MGCSIATDSRHAFEVNPLSEPNAEATLSAIPVAVENHRVGFDNVKASVAVKRGGHVKPAPVQLFTFRRCMDRRQRQQEPAKQALE